MSESKQRKNSDSTVEPGEREFAKEVEKIKAEDGGLSENGDNDAQQEL